MLRPHQLAIAYAAFAVASTAANIGAQDVSIRLYSGVHALWVSVAVGTVVGLLVKYQLDKRYIFRFRSRDALHGGWTFALYAAMGGVTTVIFWGFEFGFHYVYETKTMRYVGAVLGLALGYVLKYHLDKRFVFRTEGE